MKQASWTLACARQRLIRPLNCGSVRRGKSVAFRRMGVVGTPGRGHQNEGNEAGGSDISPGAASSPFWEHYPRTEGTPRRGSGTWRCWWPAPSPRVTAASHALLGGSSASAGHESPTRSAGSGNGEGGGRLQSEVPAARLTRGERGTRSPVLVLPTCKPGREPGLPGRSGKGLVHI